MYLGMNVCMYVAMYVGMYVGVCMEEQTLTAHLAQLAARCTEDAKVPGSNPGVGILTNTQISSRCWIFSQFLFSTAVVPCRGRCAPQSPVGPVGRPQDPVGPCKTLGSVLGVVVQHRPDGQVA